MSNPAASRLGPEPGPLSPAPGGGGSPVAAWPLAVEPAEIAAVLSGWPAGASPQEIGARAVRHYLRRPLSLSAPLHYADACTWYGALTTAGLMGDADLESALVARFAPVLTAAGSAVIPRRAHVDDRVFGIVPLEVAMHGAGLASLALGKRLADAQWAATTADGLTTEARYWVDDMYMIAALQTQAFRATGDDCYLERAAALMAAYLQRLQQADGLFLHTVTSPVRWGRGNGWCAAGMTELLSALSPSHVEHGRILGSYRKMMAALLAHQQPSGLWRQVIDDDGDGNWPEASATGMFAFALVTGVKSGWLPVDPYGSAARRAWLALGQCLDSDANVRGVCPATGEAATSGGGPSAASQVRYYFQRPRVAGDFHGQAPLLWTASALMR